MKKIMLAAMAALAITGCSQSEEMENQGTKSEIGFNTAVGKSTRVAPMTTADFTKFMVYGYNTSGNDMSSAISLSGTPFMGEVTATKANDVWGINKGPFYWPMTDKIQFFAYSPIESVTYTAPATGYPTLDYTIQPTQVDLLAVKAENQTKTTSSAGVNLLFKHILTRINFSVEYMDAAATYTVTEIKIVGVNNKGTYSYTDASWNPTSGTETYTYAGVYGGEVKENILDCSTGESSLMLMPQTLPAGAKITIAYSVTKDGVTTFSGTKDKDVATAVWATGKNIRYTLQLSSDATAISFIPKVDDVWVDEQVKK